MPAHPSTVLNTGSYWSHFDNLISFTISPIEITSSDLDEAWLKIAIFRLVEGTVANK